MYWALSHTFYGRSAQGTKKKAQKVSTSPLRPEDTPFGPTTKFCMWAKFADLINCAKFHRHWLSPFGAPGVRKSPFPIDLRYRSYNSVRTTVLHYDKCVVLTIWCEEIAVIDCDAEHILMYISDSELHRSVPLGIQSIWNDLRFVLLGTHRDLTVWVALPCHI